MTRMPDFFPNASDVTLWFDVNNSPWFVFVEQGESQRFYVSDVLMLKGVSRNCLEKTCCSQECSLGNVRHIVPEAKRVGWQVLRATKSLVVLA